MIMIIMMIIIIIIIVIVIALVDRICSSNVTNHAANEVRRALDK